MPAGAGQAEPVDKLVAGVDHPVVEPEEIQNKVGQGCSSRGPLGFAQRQPGFISTQMHRAIGESPAYLNYAVWESTADFRAAFSHPEFRAKLSAYPSSAVASPHLFQKVAVPGICVA
nr:antibiotic biosynthesis monooxygenase family protein [Rhizobium leguminosarum]